MRQCSKSACLTAAYTYTRLNEAMKHAATVAGLTCINGTLNFDDSNFEIPTLLGGGSIKQTVLTSNIVQPESRIVTSSIHINNDRT